MVILAEKPSVAKAFALAFNAAAKEKYIYKNEEKNIVVTHCIGHLLEALEPEEYEKRWGQWKYESLPIIPGTIKYKAIDGKKELLNKIKKILEEAQEKSEDVIIATDAGREGEVIARLVLWYAGYTVGNKAYRFWESEALTPEVIKRGIEKKRPLSEYNKLAKEGLAWKACDWLYGINMTRCFTITQKKLMTVGRVQTAVLNEILKREEERENFQEEKYSEITLVLEDGLKLVLINEAKGGTRFPIESSEVKKAIEELQKEENIRITKVTREQKRKPAPQLYDITQLEREAFRVYGYEPAETLKIAQKLYEPEEGALSYPRTPSRVMGESNVEMVRELYRMLIEAEPEYSTITSEKKITIENKRLFNNAELEDHHGLVVLKHKKKSESEEYKIWEMVKIRFLMQMADEYIVEEQEVEGEVGQYKVKGKVTSIEQTGWKGLQKFHDEEAALDQVSMKKYREGTEEKIKAVKKEEKKTKAKELYTYDTILGFMKNPKNEEGTKLLGIGTPATRQEILDVLKKRKYIGKKGKYLQATDDGKGLIRAVRENEIMRKNISAETTTDWERLAKENPDALVENTKSLVSKVIKSMEGSMATEVEREVIGICPACGGRIFEGEKSFYCENYKEDKGKCEQKVFKHILGIDISKEKAKELFDKGQIGFFDGTNRDGAPVSFGIKIIEKEINVAYSDAKTPIGRCPKCGKAIYCNSKSYYCSGHNDTVAPCDFSLWKQESGAVFTEDMVIKLIAGATLDNIQCETVEKEKYLAGFKLNEQGKMVKIQYGGQKKNG